jgi:endopeptidase La
MDKNNKESILIYYLKRDYKIRAHILNNLSIHIDNLYDNYVITTDDKKKINILVNDTINNLNKYYNDVYAEIISYKENISIDESEYDKNYYFMSTNNDTNHMNSGIFDILDILKNNNCVELFEKNMKLADFKIIDIEIKKISLLIGLSKLSELFILYGISNTIFNTEELEKIKLIEHIFIPYSSKYLQDKRLDKRNKQFEFLLNTLPDEKYSLLLGNNYQIKIRFQKQKTVLEINGYLINDCLNSLLRTAHLNYTYIYDKKKKFITELDKINFTNKNFKSSYITNLFIGELLTLDENMYKNKITDDYNKFIKYSNMNFKTIMAEFIHSDILHKFDIIKFLLLGTSTSINIAALLFAITKDQRESIDNNSKPTLISDLIYKNLKFSSQIKLKKSDIIFTQELEKLNKLSTSDIDLKKQIVTNKAMPDYVKKIALEKLEELKSGSTEHSKHMDYIKSLVEFPWIPADYSDIFSNLNMNLTRAKDFINDAKYRLDSVIYGHDKCKDAIIELIAKWISNPKSIGKCIGLRGPPGVGKTLFGKALGDVLNIPFSQINVGGIDDAAILSGHSFTYSNAQPGLIIRKMVKAGSPRCIIFIDEIDKAGIKHGINEIMNVLIHITDPNSNDNFNDKFFQEVTFPLNKVLFIFSYNDQTKVDKILLDRLEQIKVDTYNSIDKLNIFKNYLLKEICEEINIPLELLYFEDNVIEYIIENFTNEAGVRNFKRKIEKILLKLNLDRIYSRNHFKNDSNSNIIKITKDLVDEVLEKPNINIKKILSTNEIGIINGLYATDSGIGGILPILIYKKCDGTSRFKLKMTGSQKSVMKESIMFSYTIATNLLKPEIINNFIKNNPDGLHIHTPDGATPKDGPSAGSAFTTAFISKILNLPIKNNIAMTGEIETNGNITAIGGLDSKLSGAKKAGVNLVCVPKENESDFNKIIKKNKSLIDDTFKVVIVEHIREILDYVLIDKENLITKPSSTNITFTNKKTFNHKLYFNTCYCQID